MIIIHLKEFIKTGKFGTIAIGSTKNDLVDTLGREFEFLDCDQIQIIKYGQYEFSYWTETELIFGIQNDHLQANCANHNEMIYYKNNLWIIDTWFLQVGSNRTFEQVEYLLNAEDIPFDTASTQEGGKAVSIRCSESGIVFDFTDKYKLVEYNKKGKFKNRKEVVENKTEAFVLNGISVFDY